ncbi:hypothetical protein LLE49_01640 [Alicyclobacillus tolerans]|uniref:hypothetical protein n=1 Tax=Alicyclobacillus tolerans TaxID=90970 RepID=UPI001F1D099A|nr:hypothetical protein [Alicyclobacillus tolerans]MCF8563445.1 hypothetical protein [Alicyclobacillus tolerans]
MDFSWHYLKEYWKTLYFVMKGPSAIRETMDIPLQQALPRARWFTFVSVLLVGVFLWVSPTSGIVRLVSGLHIAAPTHAHLTSSLMAVAIILISMPVVYGLFRLYTLLAHVMSLNVFKARGQRLRLLNMETTLLTLAVPIAAGYVVLQITPVGGWLLILAFSLYGFVLASYGYNLIFHKQGLRGSGLLIGSALVTGFVLAIGALAVLVSLAVIAFLILLLLRLFVHHSAG